MPELSNSFKAGKMNKDLDERLVSNGEYRDASNIEVTTSEGSNVGTAQTILGNRQVTSLLSKRLVGCDGDDRRIELVNKNYTIGHIVDEKVDRIIRLVATPADENGGVGIDRVMEYNTDPNISQIEIPILVDIYQVDSEVTVGGTASFTINTNSQYIREGMKFKMEKANGIDPTSFTWAEDITIKTITYSIDKSNINYCYSAVIEFERSNGEEFIPNLTIAAGDLVFFKSERVLNFDDLTSGTSIITQKNTVTGINIIDDMLFWTDNYSEPKKINIPRCKLGTQKHIIGTFSNSCTSGDIVIPAHEVHTALVTKDINKSTGLNFPEGTYTKVLDPDLSLTTAIKEEHVTVIRKSPTMPPTIETFKTTNVDNDPAGTELPAITTTQAQLLMATLINNANVPWSTTPPSNPTTNQFTFYEYPGYQSSATITDFVIGTVLKFSIRHTDSVGLYQTAELIATVDTVVSPGEYTMTINSTSSNHPVNPPTPTSANHFTYNVEVVDKKPMWEVKFPRFAYRYKYSDGEYSCFGPFSNVAFIPSKFDYLPVKGYNLGMQNNLRYLEISDWVPKDIPKDVVQVDLMYKETSSPNVYTVESFKPNDEPCPTCNSINYWNQQGTRTTNFGAAGSGVDKTYHKHYGAFIVKTDLIHATVPANQLLRPWDNVPRKAIAQEMIGNRIVYANYLQNYNLIGGNNQNTIPKPEFELSLNRSTAWTDQNNPHVGTPGQSLKSMRNYQLGVVYRDKYGRETPVLTSQSGTITVPKENAPNYNKLEVGITTDHPSWAKSFKFFVKETSNEYYNLAMDRYYTAKDGNIWLSFPSSERNKVTEDSFLILKKEHNNHKPVTEKAKYKIIAIESNAPDFIKTEKQSWGSISPNPTFVDSGAPYTGKQNIEIELDQWNNSAFGGLVTQDIVGIQIKVRTTAGDYESLWYDVTNVGTVNYGTATVKRLTIKNVFGEDMEFTSEDGGISMVPNLVLEVRQKKVINRAQFDGRFFVKIQKDSVLETRLQSAWGNTGANLIPLLSKKLSYMDYCGVGIDNERKFNDWDQYREYYSDGGNGVQDHVDGSTGLYPAPRNVNGSGIGNYTALDAWRSVHPTYKNQAPLPGHTNYAHRYSVPNNDFVETGIHGLTVDPRGINIGTNDSTTMYEDLYYSDQLQPMVCPLGSRWNCQKGQNSSGPIMGRSRRTVNVFLSTSGAAAAVDYNVYNDPYWTPADANNGPWKGNGSCHVRGTGVGGTTWADNFSGHMSPNSSGLNKNPVGGMLGEYCNETSIGWDASSTLLGGKYKGACVGDSSLGNPAVNWDEAPKTVTVTWPASGSAPAVAFGALIGFFGLGTFSNGKKDSKDLFDPYFIADVSNAAGYNWNPTYVNDVAGAFAYHSSLKDEISGGTGYWGQRWLRHQWVHGNNPADVDSYPIPYLYHSSEANPGQYHLTHLPSYVHGLHFGTALGTQTVSQEKMEAYPPLGQDDKWVDWTCTQNPLCNTKYGTTQGSCSNSAFGSQALCVAPDIWTASVAGYITDTTNKNFWVFANRTNFDHHGRPEPNIELPHIWRDEQYPLLYPRKTNAHPSEDWFKDWWGGKNSFYNIRKPSDVITSSATYPDYRSTGTTDVPEDDPSKRWFIDYLGAAQDKAGAGLWKNSTTGELAIDISFIGIGDNKKDNTIWNMSESPSEMGFADAISTPGTRFRFKEDHNKVVYTITQSRINVDGESGYIDPQTGDVHTSANVHNENPEILNYENDPEDSTYSHASNRRIRWRLLIDKPIGGQGEENTTIPYYDPINKAVDYNLIDTEGTHLTNPSYNPLGLTTGVSGEVRGVAEVETDEAATNSKIIVLTSAHDYIDAYEYAQHNLSVGLTMIQATTASNAKYLGENITDTNDFGIKIEAIDHSKTSDAGDRTVIYLNKAVTVTSGADLKFRVDPTEVKSYEFPYKGGDELYSSTLPWDHEDRLYWDSNFQSNTSNVYGFRNYRYDVGSTCTFVAGSHVVTVSNPSVFTTPTDIGGKPLSDDRKLLVGDTVQHAGAHRNAHIVSRNLGVSFTMSHPAVASVSSAAPAFYRSGRTGLNEWGLNYQTIEILTSFDDSGNDSDLPMSPNPCIWETEPREDLGMDIYMEASQAYPINMDVNIGEEYIEVGDLVEPFSGTSGAITDGYVTSVNGNILTLSEDISSTFTLGEKVTFIKNVYRGDGTVESKHYKNATVLLGTSGTDVLKIQKEIHKEKRTLKYFNCFSFQNGVESNRMRDDYNAVTIDKGVKASMPMATPYEEERRKSGFIFSGIYNSTSGVNETNQFIQAEPITKDLNPAYGSIQKIFARDTDLVTFCEDKVFKVLANKDAVYSAGGNANLTATNKVLGATIPFSGEYGMSDRRSFAEQSFRMYFADANRGAIIRLSRDGMTPISDYGMKDYFFDNLKDYTRIVGTFDDRKDIYNLTLDEAYSLDAKTISYTEDTRGWVSFKSFIPESGCGFNNNYYTFNNGEIWRHHDETCVTVTANTAGATAYNPPTSSIYLTVDSIPPQIYSSLGAYSNPNFSTNNVPVIEPLDRINYGNYWAVSGRGINDSVYVKGISPINTSGCEIQYTIVLSDEVTVEYGTPVTFCAPRNNFYGDQYDSSVNILFNGGPEVVKSFATMKYEGSQALLKSKNMFNVTFCPQDPTVQYPWTKDGEYFNNIEKFGWYVNSIKTDQQYGKVRDFKNKEGKWFNYIIGEKRNNDLKKESLNTSEFSLQGIGMQECVTDFDLDLHPLEVELRYLSDGTITDNWTQANIPQNYWADINQDNMGGGTNTTIKLFNDPSVSSHFSQHAEGVNFLPGGTDQTNFIKFIIDPLPGYFINALSYGVLGGEISEGGQPGDGYSVWTGLVSGQFIHSALHCSSNPETCIGPLKIEFRDTTVGWQADNNIEVTITMNPSFYKSAALDHIKPIIVGDATKLGSKASVTIGN